MTGFRARVLALTAGCALLATACAGTTGDGLAETSAAGDSPTGSVASSDGAGATDGGAVSNDGDGSGGLDGRATDGGGADGAAATDGAGDDAAQRDDTGGDIEAVGTATLLTGDGEASLNPSDPQQSKAVLTIDEVRSTREALDSTASAGTKFVVVEFQVLGVQYGNFFENAFRLQAADEWYSPVSSINLIIQIGEVVNDAVVFEIPAEANDLVLEVGAPPILEEGWTTTFGITFPG